MLIKINSLFKVYPRDALARQLTSRAAKRFSNVLMQQNKQKYANLIKEHDLRVLERMEPSAELMPEDLKTLNLTQKDTSVRKIAKNYTTITKFFITNPRHESKVKELQEAYLRIMSHKIAYYDTLTPEERKDMKELMANNLKVIQAPSTQSRQEELLTLMEESKVYQWNEPKYLNLILLVGWLGIGVYSFSLDP